jgi:hypothetical protein
MRPIVDLQLTVAKLQAWHKAMFNNVDSFGDKTIGELRDRGLQAGPRLCPSKELVKQALARVDVRGCYHMHGHAIDPPIKTRLTKRSTFLRLQRLYHLADIHPFLDGNGRMGRYVSKHTLESTLPLPFPMYDVMDEYVALSNFFFAIAIFVDASVIVFAMYDVMDECVVRQSVGAICFFAQSHTQCLCSSIVRRFVGHFYYHSTLSLQSTM